MAIQLIIEGTKPDAKVFEYEEGMRLKRELEEGDFKVELRAHFLHDNFLLTDEEIKKHYHVRIGYAYVVGLLMGLATAFLMSCGSTAPLPPPPPETIVVVDTVVVTKVDTVAKGTSIELSNIQNLTILQGTSIDIDSCENINIIRATSVEIDYAKHIQVDTATFVLFSDTSNVRR